MPALPPVPNTLKCQLLWNDSSDVDVSSTLFFSYSGGAPGSSDCSNFAVVLVNSFAAQLDLWHSDTVLTGGTVTDLTSPSAATGSAAANHPGGETGSPLAGGTCVVAGYRINRRYRGGKPRNYFPWGTASDLATRQGWNPSYVTEAQSGIQTAIQAFVGQVEGGTTILAHVNVSYYEGSKVVISPTTGRAKNVPILRATPRVDNIVGISVNTSPGSQRRRNR
jgi:hypothetical protein